MKHCEKCGIDVADEIEYCPLCHRALVPLKDYEGDFTRRNRIYDEELADFRREESKARELLSCEKKQKGSGAAPESENTDSALEEAASAEETAAAETIPEPGDGYETEMKKAPSKRQIQRDLKELEFKIQERRNGHLAYPNVYFRQHRMAQTFRALFLAAVISGSLLGFINYHVNPQFPWSVIVMGVMAYITWMFFLFSRDSGYLKRIFGGLAGFFILGFLIDYLLGFRLWSINYVLPCAIVAVDATLLLLMLINRRNWQSYIIFQILMIFIGLIPIILMRLGLISHPILSELSFMTTILVFVGTLILGGRRAREELERRFHL